MSESDRMSFEELIKRPDMNPRDVRFWKEFFHELITNEFWIESSPNDNAVLLTRMFTAMPFRLARKKRTKKVAAPRVDTKRVDPVVDDPTPDFEDTNVVETRRYWGDKYMEKYGNPYVFNYGRDTKLLKVMMESAGDIRPYVDMFFDDNDDFVLRAGRTIPVFYSRFNVYIQRGVQNDESSIINRY